MDKIINLLRPDIFRIISAAMIYIIAGLIAGETEQIMNDLGKFGLHKGTWFPNWKWWNSNNWKYENPLVQWLMRYPLSFLKDGYHFTGSTYRVLLIVATAALFRASIEQIIYAALFGYIFFGIAFNFSYHN